MGPSLTNTEYVSTSHIEKNNGDRITPPSVMNYSLPVEELTMTDYLTHTRNKSTIRGDYLIAWKLYPINEYGQIIDEEGIAIRSICDAVRFKGDQLFSPSGRVDTFHPMSKSQ